ncbi:MAG: TonB-dependent receptor [Deltaproteobacteria bacterium]|nr:TonB-dependent receptor [Deltaproteobacteria bacterium]
MGLIFHFKPGAVIIPLMLIIAPLFMPASAYAAKDVPTRIASNVYEMDIKQLMDLEVVTATKTKIPLRNAPSAVYVITSGQIRERGYRTLADALHDVPGFDFQNTYGIFPDLIHQRGLVGNNQRSLVYIDGIPDNNITENAVLGGTIRFPLLNVDRIEIVSGPVAVLYGANAFNGVINIITKTGKTDTRSRVETTYGGWDSDNLGGAFSFALNGVWPPDYKNPAEYGISGYYYNSDGPDFGGVQSLNAVQKGYWWSDIYTNSASETYNLTARMNFGNLRFETINWQYKQGDGTFANGTFQIDTDRHGFDGSAWNFKNNTFSIGYLWDIHPTLSLDSQAIIRHTELLDSSHEFYPNVPGPDAYNHPDDVTSATYSRADEEYRVEERLVWQATKKMEHTFGIETIYDKVPKGYNAYQRYSYKNWAGYWQGIYRFTNILSLTGGYRFDHNSAYNASHTGRASLIATPGDFTFKAMFSTGFRAPTAWELFNATLQREANSDLKPETMRSVECSGGYRFADLAYTGITAYYNTMRDLILEVKSDDPNPDPLYDFFNQNQNIGRARVIGLEWYSNIYVNTHVNLYFNYTYSHGEYFDLPPTLVNPPTVKDDNDIPNIAKHKANAGITIYALPGLSVNLRANYVYRRKTIASDPVGEAGDYILYHTNIRWEDALIPGVYAQISARNIFNRHAFDPGIRTATGEYYPTLQPLEGRNMWFTMGYEF